MGSWRKVGAFLGLVPDEGRRDEYGDEYHDADGYRDDYARDPRSAEYADDDYAGDPHGSHPDSPHDPYQPKGPRSMSTGYQDEQLTHGALAVQPRPDLRRAAMPKPACSKRPAAAMPQSASARPRGIPIRGSSTRARQP